MTTTHEPATAICPDCRGDCNYPAPYCHTCRGTGEVEDLTVCEYCDCPCDAPVLVEDFGGHRDAICRECFEAAQEDPEAFGGLVEVTA